MPRINGVCMMLVISFLLTITACKKNSKGIVDSPDLTDFPIANAGSDTAIRYPISAFTLNGSGSRGVNSNIKSYNWQMINGPSMAVLNNSNDASPSVTNLINVGYYSFELTVTSTNNLSKKDTVSLAVLAPECTTNNTGIIFRDLTWNTAWMMEIDIENIYSLLPSGSQIKNIYIKRDGSQDWEVVKPGYDEQEIPGSILIICCPFLQV